MSELEARKYTSIRMLREDIRQDMQDYKLLWTDKNVGQQGWTESSYLFKINGNNIRHWFLKYLVQQIDHNLSTLEELVEQENE